jgi:alkanesulfonate monooxygenase SsuD/methylene tetrahydromethanopterin reductase-like flavin-dependent oxidoreductase (luciferase family)
MRFGTYYFLQAPPGRSGFEIISEEVEQMVLSEQLGFDSVWLTEHHYADYGLSSAPAVLAATVAARTARISIGTAVFVLPFHHPIRLAEETATLDILSKGRLVVGLGRGNRPLEFVGHLVPQEHSREYLEEGVEVLVQAWTKERVTFHGKHWQFDELPVYPKPFTKPHPPLAFAVTSSASIEWIGRNGFAMLSSGLTTPLPAVLKAREAYVQALRAAGHSQHAIDALLARWVMSKHVYVAPTDAEARADAEGPERWYLDAFARSMSPEGLKGLGPGVYKQAMEAVERIRSQRWEELVEGPLLIGSPTTVRAKVTELDEAGVGELLCWMSFGGLPPQKVRRSMRLFAEEVSPAFRSSVRSSRP